MSSLAESIAQKRKEQASDACIVSATSGQVVAFIVNEHEELTH